MHAARCGEKLGECAQDKQQADLAWRHPVDIVVSIHRCQCACSLWQLCTPMYHPFAPLPVPYSQHAVKGMPAQGALL